MPDMNYSSGPGGYTLTTSGSPGVGGSGYAPGSNQDLIDFYKEMARRAVPRMGGGGGGGAMAAPPEATVIRRGPPEKSQADRARERDELLQMQARQAPPPMRMTTFASGANNYYTPDTNAMNAYQRQAYLPGSSALAPPGAADAGSLGGDGGADFRAFQRFSGADPRGVRGEVGGAAAGTPGGSVLPRGTAPMLTPSNAAVAPRVLTEEERRRQAALNSIYGR